jgi:NADP-dependent 3-hydroxy acid dehydrogenase YdfG
MEISGSLVVVTGASGGIGAALAKELAKMGASVVLLARRKPQLDHVAADITLIGGKAWAYRVDLTDAEAVASVAASITKQVGIPDILVNNAGAGTWRFLDETAPGDAIQCMAVPYFAAFNVVHAFLPSMLRRNHGHIVNVSSVGSRFTWPGATAYLAARWAMRGFTEALRADLARSRIGLTLVEPGVVKSTYWENNPRSRERIPALAQLIPELTPEDVAQSIIRAIERNKRRIVLPFMMRVTCCLHALFPRPVQWLITRTGYHRP